MIISASRRTDLPAHYSDWFLKRIRAGFLCVRNPRNTRQLSRVDCSPEAVDGIVFWTKNPSPMLAQLDALRDYNYYFQFTLTCYGPDVECGLADKERVIVPTFQRLSDKIGPERVIWRYDPIFLSEKYTAEAHLRCFAQLARQLSPYTRSCTISFLDFYRSTERKLAPLSLLPFPPEAQEQLAARIAEIARAEHLRVNTCAEKIELAQYGIGHARCIDADLLSRLAGRPLSLRKDKSQRPHCGCVESVDVGAYNTCPNGCRYCYANFNEGAIQVNRATHDPDSPLLLGSIRPGDKVTERRRG